MAKYCLETQTTPIDGSRLFVHIKHIFWIKLRHIWRKQTNQSESEGAAYTMRCVHKFISSVTQDTASSGRMIWTQLDRAFNCYVRRTKRQENYDQRVTNIIGG
jgi:hypothetical protein